MRVYSVSQKKFIETGGQQAPVQSGSQPSGMTSIGVPDEKLRNAFFQLGLAKPSSASNLTTLYNFVKPPESTDTAEMKNKREALKPAESAIGRVKDKWLDQLGPQHHFSNISLRLLGGLGVDNRIKDLDSKFQLMKQNVVRALQGARMSDVDIQMAEKYIPTITDTPAYARIKIANLTQMIADMAGKNNVVSQNASSWERVR